MTDYYQLSVENCLQLCESSRDGLSQETAQKRLGQYGENRLPEETITPIWLVLLQQFMNPLIYILLVAGVVTIYLHEHAGAIFIFLVLLVNAIIGAIQEYSASNAALALKQMALSMARVIRDTQIYNIDAIHLVPGDIVLLESGNKIPADMRLISAVDILVNESLLTGESNDVAKQAENIIDYEAATSDQTNMLFAGSIVTHGRATGMVTSTGSHTKMGGIAKHITGRSKVRSPLIIRMERFTKQISILVGLLIVIISTLLYSQGHEPQHIFLIALGLAVAAIPEGLPVTLTIALAIGMRRMARRNVIVRKLDAVEALGSCTLIASDKTGTLTRNELTAQCIVLPSDEHYIVTSGANVTDGTITQKGAV